MIQPRIAFLEDRLDGGIGRIIVKLGKLSNAGGKRLAHLRYCYGNYNHVICVSGELGR